MKTNKPSGNMYEKHYTTNPLGGDCQHKCDYCLPKGALILMSDFSLKPIENIIKGDEVIGLDKDKSGYKRFKKSKVKGIMNRVANTIIIETENSTIECTPDHQLMGGSITRVGGTDWKQTKAFSPYEVLKYVGMPKEKSKDYYRGWLCGFIEGDGCFFEYQDGKYLGFEAVSIDDEILDAVIERASLFGIELRKGKKKITSKKSFTCGNEYAMVTTRKTDVAKRLQSLTQFNYEGELSFYEGYVGGILDAEGTITEYIRISQLTNSDVLKHINYSLERQGFNYVVENKGTRLRISKGMKTRLKILWNCSPACIKKRKNLMLGRTIKAVPKDEIKCMSIGRECKVYNIETETENYIANGFIVHNCYVNDLKSIPVLKEKYEGKVRLYPNVLTGNTGTGKTIFLCNCNDMFQSGVKDEDITAIIRECRKYPDNTYLFQSKNPTRMLDWVYDLPPRSILATTIETDDQDVLNDISKAPPVSERADAMRELREKADELNTIFGVKTETQVTIEPIIKFTKQRLIKLMEIARPDIIYIGADSGDNGLPEPTDDEIIELVKCLKERLPDSDIRLKENLDRLTGKI